MLLLICVSNYMLLFQKSALHSGVLNSEDKQSHYFYEDYNFGMLHVETLKVVFIFLVTDFLALKTCPYDATKTNQRLKSQLQY